MFCLDAHMTVTSPSSVDRSQIGVGPGRGDPALAPITTVEFDLPGVSKDSVDLDVERNVLTVRAERVGNYGDSEPPASERPRGMFSRQLVLGDNLDLDQIEATYAEGVLRLTVPVAEKAKPRKIDISAAGTSEEPAAINA
ncbi:MAG: Hsp20 family protein [Nocardioides sp.]|nr:Hsp20 family protein [Nocardioides sp.]